MEIYSQTELKRLYDENVIENSKIYKDYFLSFFYPLTDGTHAFTENNEVTIIQNDVMQRVYLARIPKEIKIWYETIVIPRKTIRLISLHDHEHFQFVVKDYDEILDARNNQIKSCRDQINILENLVKSQTDEIKSWKKL